MTTPPPPGHHTTDSAQTADGPPPAPPIAPTAPPGPATAPAPVEVDPTDATVVIDGVSKWFGNKVAVSDLSLAVRPGVTGLLGPNGAGKTTLLRLVTGLCAPSRGTVRVLGHDPRHEPAVHARMALVPEAPHVHDHLTARRFVRLRADLLGLPDPADATARALATVELDDAADRVLRTFSKGMRQRTKVAAALVGDPEVLVLDEPLNGADPVQRANLITLFRRLGAAGHTVVVSSHVLAEVDRMADRVVAMVDGRLAAVGTATALRSAITDRPRELVVRAERPHALAAALLGADVASGVDVDGTRLAVRTRDAAVLARALPALAVESGADLRHVEPVDETLESIFRDIAGGSVR